MKYNLTSTALHSGEVIDTRCLTLDFEFQMLTGSQVCNLIEDMCEWLVAFLPDDCFVTNCEVNNRRGDLKKLLLEIPKKCEKSIVWDCLLESYVISSAVFNKKTMRNHERELQYGKYASMAMAENRHFTSRDYFSYWDALFRKVEQDPDIIKEKILHLFNEEHRFSVQTYHLSDVQGYFSVLPYYHNKELHYGSFSLDFSSFCLGDNLQDAADLFCNLVTELSAKYVNLNARVMLQPVVGEHSPHTHYFEFASPGGFDLCNDVFDREKETIRSIPGVEWFNIVSPLVCQCLSRPITVNSALPGISVKEAHTGAILVHSELPIAQYDIPHAKRMKQILYDALYCGKKCVPINRTYPANHIDFSCGLRKKWEIVPVFAEEITVTPCEVIFSIGDNGNCSVLPRKSR